MNRGKMELPKKGCEGKAGPGQKKMSDCKSRIVLLNFSSFCLNFVDSFIAYCNDELSFRPSPDNLKLGRIPIPSCVARPAALLEAHEC